jgi:hypothetical protein
MSVVPATAAPASTTAVAAFLRGIGRRAVAFAELQAGDAARGDAAVAVAIRAFRDMAPTLELAHWPGTFWSELLDAAALREARPAASDWARIAAGPRAALLLRFAAGLDEADAARVLRIGVPAYRLALQSALAAATDDSATLQAQLQRRIAAIPPERVERLARDEKAAAPEQAEGMVLRPRALLAVLWTLLLLCVAAFAMTFWWPPQPEATVEAGVRIEPLPPAPAPASSFGDEAARIVHRDFALLVDTDAAPLVRELEFYGWLAAQAGAGASGAGSADVRSRSTLPDPALEPLGTPGLETDDASL